MTRDITQEDICDFLMKLDKSGKITDPRINWRLELTRAGRVWSVEMSATRTQDVVLCEGKGASRSKSTALKRAWTKLQDALISNPFGDLEELSNALVEDLEEYNQKRKTDD